MRNSWLILLLLAGSVAHAASFDCAKAKTPQEKAICASPELNAADERMAAAYRAVLTAVPPEIQAEIRDGQRAWIRRREEECPADESGSTANLAGCLRRELDSRTKELQQTVRHEAGVTFVWRWTTLKAREDDDTDPGPGSSEVNPGFGTLTATWPMVLAASPKWAAWNKAIEAAAQGMATSKEGSPVRLGSSWVATPGVDEQIGVGMGFVGPQLVTATLTNFFDGHCAHPNLNSVEFNWLFEKQRELKAEDVFRAGSGWEQELYRRTDAYLHVKLDQYEGNYQKGDTTGGMPKTVLGIVTAP